jgi:hypothetical protein
MIWLIKIFVDMSTERVTMMRELSLETQIVL